MGITRSFKSWEAALGTLCKEGDYIEVSRPGNSAEKMLFRGLGVGKFVFDPNGELPTDPAAIEFNKSNWKDLSYDTLAIRLSDVDYTDATNELTFTIDGDTEIKVPIPSPTLVVNGAPGSASLTYHNGEATSAPVTIPLTQVVNTLASGDGQAALSAKQGFVLKSMLDALTTVVSTLENATGAANAAEAQARASADDELRNTHAMDKAAQATINTSDAARIQALEDDTTHADDKAVQDAINIANDDRLTAIEARNTSDANRLDALENDNTHATDKAAQATINASDASRLSALETQNTSAANRLAALEAIDHVEVTVTDALTSSSATAALSAKQGKALNDKITAITTLTHLDMNAQS